MKLEMRKRSSRACGVRRYLTSAALLNLLTVIQFRTHNVPIDEFCALGGGVVFLDSCGDFTTVGCQPRFLFVQQRDSALDKLIHGTTRPARDILSDQLLKFRAKMKVLSSKCSAVHVRWVR